MAQILSTCPRWRSTPAATPGNGHPPRSLCRDVDSASLFDGMRELVIAHNGDTYYLRRTRNEKLILTR